jgi:hypothetical protein
MAAGDLIADACKVVRCEYNKIITGGLLVVVSIPGRGIVQREVLVKKLVMLVVLVFLLVGCSSPEPEIVKETVVVEQTGEVEKVVKETVLVTEIVQKIVTATPLPKPTQTNTPETPEIGTKNNPYAIGESAPMIMSGTMEFTYSVTDVIRGDDAYAMIKDFNQFNDPPPVGFEYVLVYADVAYIGEDQGILEIGETEIQVVTQGQIMGYFDFPSICCLEPGFDLKLMQGGNGGGYFALPVKVGDENPLLLLGEASGGVFFSLTPHESVVTPLTTPEPIIITPTTGPEEDALTSAYVDVIMPVLTRYQTALAGFSELSERASSDPTLTDDEEWLSDATELMLEIITASSEIRELQPTQELALSHVDLLLAAHYYDEAMKYFAQGVDNGDVEKINQSSAAIKIANGYIVSAQEKIPW